MSAGSDLSILSAKTPLLQADLNAEQPLTSHDANAAFDEQAHAQPDLYGEEHAMENAAEGTTADDASLSAARVTFAESKERKRASATPEENANATT